MKTNWESLIENHYNKDEKLNMNSLVRLVEQVMNSPIELQEESAVGDVGKKKVVRFSEVISIPRLTPSEAWGDPSSQSRKDIDKIFRSITGGQDIKKRLESINKFLNPETAKNKRSPGLIMNMMMITEALQATLNDFNESASGFVFEGFMAALTGGKQEAGRVAGTLPIEDFVAFTEFGGDSLPVSLKLLTSGGNVKGSFTNLVDFLFVRGTKAIRYLITYKTTTRKGVEGLLFFAFDITTDNLAQFIEGTKGEGLFAPYTVQEANEIFTTYNHKKPDIEQARKITQMSGYQDAGFLNDLVEKGEIEFEDEKKKAADKEAAALAQQAKATRDLKRSGYSTDQINEMLDAGSINPNQAFHQLEKLAMEREDILNEGKGDGKSQWSASWAQMRETPGLNFEVYGQLNLSQTNIEELVDIYSSILGQTLLQLLTATKEMTENIGAYYSEKRRSSAQAAGKTAETKTTEVKGLLEKDPRFSEEEGQFKLPGV